MTELQRLQTKLIAKFDHQDFCVADDLEFFDTERLLDAVGALLRGGPLDLPERIVRVLAATALNREIKRRLEVMALEDDGE